MREVGDRIGPYVLVRPLGAGGAGEVWEAELHGPAGFRKAVALKLLRTGLGDPATRDALSREARLGALLQHPNVVGTLQLGEHDGTWCIALELVRGLSVDALCARQPEGRLPPGAVLDVGVQVAAGLHHVHTFDLAGRRAGLVHRDVKPANLLVDRSGLVKIADLGISLLRGEAHRVAGTPGFMAPEQVLGRPEPRSDLFALGAVLYAAATGKRAFARGAAGRADVERVEKLLASEGFLKPVEAAAPGLAAVVRWCLRRDPEQRPASARELGDALAALRVRQGPGPSVVELLARAAPELRVEPTDPPISEAPSRAVPMGNLRPPRDAFVGREAELAALAALVTREPWVVLAGPGGAGKTRLALEVARSVRDRIAGGAWAFDLAAARTEDQLCAAVAHALDLELEREDPSGQVGRVLRAKGPALVVLDNLEQCVHALPGTVQRWRDLAPECRFLGTSRVVPGLNGERLVWLGALGRDDAAALFVARAPREVADDELDEVRLLCEALEGMPLAIELAAARLRVFDVRGLRARLSLALLSGGSTERPERQRSVAASLAWSWDLLSPAGRHALAELSVFEGGFAPEGAEAVLDLTAFPGVPWALDVIQELCDASLLRVDAGGGRFRLPVVVREFAAKRAPPDERRAAEVRHGALFAQRGTLEALEALDGPGGADRLRALAQELDDLLAACRRAVARGDGAVAVATVGAARAVGQRGAAPAVMALATEVLGLPLAPGDRALAELYAALSARLVGRPRDALPRFEAALEAFRAAGDRRSAASALYGLGSLHADLGHPAAALPWLVQAVELAREVGSVHLEGIALGALGLVNFQLGRLGEARDLFDRALAIHRRAGNVRSEGVLLGNVAILEVEEGRPDAARAHCEQAIAVHRDLGDARALAVALGNLGTIHQEQGRPDEARACYERAYALHREVGNRRSEGIVLGNLGNLHKALGGRTEARACYLGALAVHREVGNRRSEAIVLGNLGHLELLEGRHAEARARCGEALALHRALGDRRLESGVLLHLAAVHEAEGQRQEARASCEQALALVREVGDRSYEGIALAQLGRLVDDPEAAAALLAEAEPLLRDARAVGELALAVVARGELRLRAGDGAGARDALDEAERLAPWDAEVAGAVARVRERLGPP